MTPRKRGNEQSPAKRLTPRRGSSPGKSVPASSAVPFHYDDRPFKWSAKYIDHSYAGGWSWSLSPKAVADVMRLLEEMSQLTWREIRDQKANSKNNSRAKHHPQKVSEICKEAQDRLIQLQRGDQYELFRFRHGNLIRLWGVIELGTFYVLWYDGEHRVCPTEGN